MKIPLILLLALFIIQHGGYAQTGKTAKSLNDDTAYIIHYTFSNGKLDLPNHIKWHPPVYRPFIVRIDSINRGAFKIRITSRDSLIAVNDPSPFTTVFSNLQKVKPSIKDTIASNTGLNKGVKSLQSHKAENIAKSNVTLKKQKKNPVTQQEKDEVKLRSTEIASENILLEGEANTFLKFPDTTASGKKLSQNDTLYRAATYKAIKTLYFRTRRIKDSLLRTADSVSYAISDIDRSVNAMKYHFLTRKKFEQNYLLTEDSLRKYLLKIKQIYSSVPGIAVDLHAWEETSKRNFNDTFFRIIDEAALTNLEDVYKSIHVDSLLTALDKINLTLQYLKSDEFYRYTSPPITPFGDMIIVKVGIEAIDKDTTQPDDEKVYELKLFTKNRFRFDFSTGIGALFNLSDRSYKMDNIGADSLKINQLKVNQKLTPVIAAFLHGGFDIGSSFKPAITLGMSLDASSVDITTILFGVSAMLGRDDKLELSTGWAMKKISVLKSEFETGKTYAKTEVGSIIPTENVFKTGWFISLSYNLTNKQTQK